MWHSQTIPLRWPAIYFCNYFCYHELPAFKIIEACNRINPEYSNDSVNIIMYRSKRFRETLLVMRNMPTRHDIMRDESIIMINT